MARHVRSLSRAIALLCLALAPSCTDDGPGGGSGGGGAPPDESFQRFTEFERWELHYTYEQNDPFAFVEDGRSKWYPGANVEFSARRASVTGTIPLEVTYVDETHVQLEGSGPVSASLEERWTSTAPHHYEERWDQGSGTPTDHALVNLELDEGRYDVDLTTGSFVVDYGGTHGYVHDPIVYQGSGEEHVVYPSYDYDARPALPETGVVLSGSFSWEEYWLDEVADEPNADPELSQRYRPATGTLRWTLVPADPIDVELVVEPEDYEDWMPQGGASESTPGNSIAVRAYLRAKDGGEPTIHASSIRFGLVDVSREKGVSLNQPLTGGTTAPDLAFPATQPGGATVSDEGQSAEIEGVDDATVHVASYDWGASGALEVTAVLTNGRVVVGRLDGAEASETAVRLPRRRADSRIADAYRELVDFSGDDTEDADVQPGNAHAGDGLSAFEEYRGMRVRGMHSRQQTGAGGEPLLRPLFKDLVVENRVGADARQGLALFQNASGIIVVELADGELHESRLANANRGAASLGEQYGLRLVAETLAGGVVGENRPVDVHGKTPKRSTLVVVDLANIAARFAEQAAIASAAGVPMPYTLAEDRANTVAHELAHGLGAPHHGAPTEWFGPWQVTEAMTSYHVYGFDGLEVATRPFMLEGSIGRPGNDASGDSGCIMAYTGAYSWAAVGPAGGPYDFYSVGVQPVGAHFCASAAATGMNVPHAAHGGAEVPGFFGDAAGQGGGAPVGNCLGAMRVRDF